MKKIFIFLFAFFFISTGITFAAFSLPFSDLQNLPDFTWYKSAVYRLYHAGILKTDGGKDFRPNDSVNRAEIATMIDRSLSNKDYYFMYTNWKMYNDAKYHFSILYPSLWNVDEHLESYNDDLFRKSITFTPEESNFGYDIFLIDTPLSLEEYVHQYSLQFSGNRSARIESLEINGELARKVVIQTYLEPAGSNERRTFNKEYEVFLKRENTIFMIQGFSSLTNDFENFYNSFRFEDRKYPLHSTTWEKHIDEENMFSFLCPPFWSVRRDGNEYLGVKNIFGILPRDHSWAGDYLLRINVLPGKSENILQNTWKELYPTSQITEYKAVLFGKNKGYSVISEYTNKGIKSYNFSYFISPPQGLFTLEISLAQHLFDSPLVEALLTSFEFTNA